MKQIWYISLVVSTLLLSSFIAKAQYPGHSPTIIVSLDFTEALAKVLTANTDIGVSRIIPPDYSPDTHTYYLKKNWQSFSQQVQHGDAVISPMGAWSKDPLYPWARKANIRIVPIDIVTPLDGSQAGVPLPNKVQQANGVMDSKLQHVWNSPGNCARMADIAAMDLVRLFPGEKETINRNLTIFKQELFKLRTQYEMKFGSLEAFEIGAFTTDYLSLTDEFGIHVVEFFLKPEIRWQEADFQALAERTVSSDLPAVLCKWQPKEEIAQTIIKNGANVVVLKPFRLGDAGLPANQLLDFYKTNLALLLEGLSQGSSTTFEPEQN